MVRHQDKLRSNPRMHYVFSTWDRLSLEKQEAIRTQAAKTLRETKESVLRILNRIQRKINQSTRNQVMPDK